MIREFNFQLCRKYTELCRLFMSLRFDKYESLCRSFFHRYAGIPYAECKAAAAAPNRVGSTLVFGGPYKRRNMYTIVKEIDFK